MNRVTVPASSSGRMMAPLEAAIITTGIVTCSPAGPPSMLMFRSSPLLKNTTAMAPAFWAFKAFSPKSQVPR